MASGLAAAHAQGLIHRDINPGNILLESGAEQKVKITDFGLARAADDASMTRTGVISGTPMYMAPEQAQGQALDHRADLFSLGSVLYQMASGRPPFRGPTTIAVLKRVTDETPRPIQEIFAEVPDWLCAIIGKLHAKNPDDRFRSAKEVADLLARCQASLQQHGRVELPDEILPLVPQPEPPAEAATKAEPEPTAPERALPPHSPRDRRWIAAATMILVVFAGLGMTKAAGGTKIRGTVIRLFSPDGTLVVEVDDPGMSISIDGEDMVITETGAKEIRLKPGQYKVLVSKDGKVVRQELVTVTKNGRQVVRLSREAAPVAQRDGGVIEPKKVSADPDRRAAEYVLSIGGAIRVNGEDRDIKAAAELPAEPFALTGTILQFNQKVTDQGMENLKGCNNLTLLHLGYTVVGDTGLANFKDCRKLTALYLAGGKTTDTGLSYFKDCKDLTVLSLHGMNITNAGLGHFKDCKKLTSLQLRSTPLIGSSLDHFKDCKELTFLDLCGTRLNPAELVHFKDCKHLTHLDLDGVLAGDTDLASFDHCQNLVYISLKLTKVTDTGVARFKDCNKVRFLALTDTPVTDSALDSLKNCKDLEELELDGTRVTDRGLGRLVDCQRLKALGLARTEVTEAGLAPIKECKNLQRLNLNQTALTDSSVDVLGKFSRSKLRWLSLKGTKMTATGVKKLAAALPLCHIESDHGTFRSGSK